MKLHVSVRGEIFNAPIPLLSIVLQPLDSPQHQAGIPAKQRGVPTPQTEWTHKQMTENLLRAQIIDNILFFLELKGHPPQDVTMTSVTNIKTTTYIDN